MNKETISDMIRFICPCGKTIDGDASDTLMAEEFLEISASSSTKYDDFINNSPYDPAGLKVAKACPKCTVPFMTMVRVGDRETALYICSCGYRNTHDKYEEEMKERANKK
jgi:hypothetical protein